MGLIKSEEARIEKVNGDIIGPYKASFAGSVIIIDDQTADVEEGDTILRQLPNGKDERSIVTEATFYNTGAGRRGPHYQVKFRKGAISSEHKPVQNINISGAQSIQIGDYNNQNIINSFEALSEKIDSSSASEVEKEEAKSLLSKCLSHPLVVSVLGSAVGTIGG
ncbi:RIP homotypic interaction motif-containing protein [Vibrio diabolicus]|uniref:RIP homotypic interaction motif-containing protein n=1 Tax=Vibrio diabolicus TaxID=50719 RepID=UPI002160EF83|nr:RIP homotypic interaction motif-containing protein [Vibrio diabolicus]MCS0445090.1 hypothetical protein [Vibrio diabolicus]